MTATTSSDRQTLSALVSKLSLHEKVAQLTGLAITDLMPRTQEGPSTPAVDVSLLPGLRPHGVGHLSLAWFVGTDASSLRQSLATVQDAVRELSPFGIGALIHNEAVNGFLHVSGSQFPTAWAQAASWDPSLTQRAAQVSADHLRHAGMHLAFAPVLDLARDPRWGRVHETYGEDPELVSQFGIAFVRGIQGTDADSGLVATAKHFAGYSASEGGLNQAITQLGQRALLDEYVEPFRRAIAEAGLLGVMNSYNDIDGVPAAAHRWLLTDVLRGQLDFEGLVVSDYDSINMLRTIYHTAVTEGDAARQALTAGLDVELPGDPNYSFLVEEVEAGRLEERVVDEAVLRVLRIKARTGLVPEFRPQPSTSPDSPTDVDEARRVREEIAERGAVLLQNDGTLPLAAGSKRLVVVGPAADELRVHFGAYTSVSSAEMPLSMVALLEGRVPGVDPQTFVFTDIFQARFPGFDPVFEECARSMHPQARTLLSAMRTWDPEIAFVPLGSFETDGSAPLDADLVAAAVNDADVVIAAVGERTGWAGNNTAGEGQSTATPTLPGDQLELIELLALSGKPVVTVVVSGRPLILDRVSRASDAVLLAPLLGEEAGPTIASILFGGINPSGKLPSTFPRTVGQIPIYHGHHYGSGYDHPTGTRHGYGDLDEQTPLYPFGFGLSYSAFELGFADSDLPVELVDGSIRARLVVSNTSQTTGETVVQLYARDEEAAVVRPVRQLVQFQRVRLEAGASAEVVLEAPLTRLHYTQLDGSRGIEAGDVTLMAAFSSEDVRCCATLSVPASPS